MTGTVPATESAAIRQRLRDAVVEVTVGELGPVANREAWVVLAHVSVADEVRSILNLTRFAEVEFPGLSDYPAEELELARAEIVRIDGETERLTERANELAAAEYANAVAWVEAFQSARGAITVRERLGATERAVLLTGWVPVRSRAALEAALEPLGDLIDLTLEEPTDEDSPPVLLDNPKLLKPFETLTDLYGRPRVRRARSDAAAGAVLPHLLRHLHRRRRLRAHAHRSASGSSRTRLDVAPGVKRFSDLMMIGGAAAMVVGVLFGSYFAIDFAVVTRVLPFLKPLQLIDPLAELQTFLLFTVALGVIQVFFGVLVAAYDAARKGDYSGAVNDQISTIVLAVMIAIAVIVPGASSCGRSCSASASRCSCKGHAHRGGARCRGPAGAGSAALGGAWLGARGRAGCSRSRSTGLRSSDGCSSARRSSGWCVSKAYARRSSACSAGRTRSTA